MWEADDSNSEWYDALGDALKTAAKMLDDLPWWVDLVPTPKLWDYVTLSVKFLATFWEAMRNHDDQGLTHALVFGPADLAMMYTPPGEPEYLKRMNFDARSTGQGNFSLYFKYVGERPQLPPPLPPLPPDRTLWMTASTDGEAWGNPTVIAPAEEAKQGAALAVFGDRLHCAFSDYRTLGLVHTRFDGTDWSPVSPIPTPDMEAESPALAVFNDRLRCIAPAMTPDGHIHLAHATLDGDTWSAFTKVPMPTLARDGYPPALAVFDNRLYCFVLESTGLHQRASAYTTFDGSTWSNLRRFATSGGQPVAAAVFRGKLHYVTRSESLRELQHRSFDGSSWSDRTPFAEGPPALTVHNDRLHCLVSAGSSGWGKLMRTSFDGHSWSPLRERHYVKASTQPALASCDGTLYCAYRMEEQLHGGESGDH